MIRPLTPAQQRLFTRLLCLYGPAGIIPPKVVRGLDWRIMKGLIARGLVWPDLVDYAYHIGSKRRRTGENQ